METITGTVYVDNDFSFYINGELIIEDPVPIIRHNAVNVSFRVPRGKNITFAIDARDWADDISGLEYDNRCVGDGGLRAMFNNGVVTNKSWVCSTYHYGPINWKDCFGAQMVRDQSYQLLPQCKQNSTPQLTGCTSRYTTLPTDWVMSGFDDSRWEYASEFTPEEVGWGLRPAGCENPGTVISSEVDSNGDPITCPENLDWGNANFIWRPSLDLDNRIVCRYTVKLEESGTRNAAAGFLATMMGVVISITT